MPTRRAWGSEPRFMDPADGYERREDVLEGMTAQEVSEWVAGDQGRAQTALTFEQAGPKRKSVIEDLEDVLGQK